MDRTKREAIEFLTEKIKDALERSEGTALDTLLEALPDDFTLYPVGYALGHRPGGCFDLTLISIGVPS